MIGRHISPEAIARYGEGDVSGRRAARIGAHLSGCARCAAVRDDLDRVPALLAQTQIPPMPDHLADRIQTALMTESARRAGQAAGAASTRAGRSAAPAPSGPPRRRAPRAFRAGLSSWPGGRAAGLAAAAAAAVLVVGGGSYLIAARGGGGTGSSSSGVAGSAGPGQSQVSEPAAPQQRAAGPAVTFEHAGRAGSFTPVAGRVTINPGTLKAQAQDMLADYRKTTGLPLPTSGTGQSAGSPGEKPNAGTTTSIGGFRLDALAGCVARTVAAKHIILVETVTYQASPAVVIIAAASDQSPVKVWLAGPGCSAATSDIRAQTALPPGT